MITLPSRLLSFPISSRRSRANAEALTLKQTPTIILVDIESPKSLQTKNPSASGIIVFKIETHAEVLMFLPNSSKLICRPTKNNNRIAPTCAKKPTSHELSGEKMIPRNNGKPRSIPVKIWLIARGTNGRSSSPITYIAVMQTRMASNGFIRPLF